MSRFFSWARGDRSRWVRTWEDWCILCYYLGTVAVGCIAIGADDTYQYSGYGDVWAIATASVGVVAAGAWLDRSRHGEAVLIVAMAALTFAHGLMVLGFGGDASLQFSFRLLIAPLMMIPYAWHRARRCVDPELVREVIERPEAP